MLRETYLKPEIKSEVLKPGALATDGSGVTGGGSEPGPIQVLFPLFGICCN